MNRTAVDLFGPPMVTVSDQVFMGPPHSAAARLQRGMTIEGPPLGVLGGGWSHMRALWT